MAIQEYVRSLPELDLHGRPSLSYRLHVDLPLLFLLLLLCGAGLLILFSASGGDLNLVQKQGVRVALAFFVMLVVAQFDPRTFQR